MTGLHWPSLRPTLIDHGRLLHAITVEGELLARVAGDARHLSGPPTEAPSSAPDPSAGTPGGVSGGVSGGRASATGVVGGGVSGGRAAGAGPGDLPVPGCPGATVASTVEHTGTVYLQALDWIRGGGRPDRLRRAADYLEPSRPPSASRPHSSQAQPSPSRSSSSFSPQQEPPLTRPAESPRVQGSPRVQESGRAPGSPRAQESAQQSAAQPSDDAATLDDLVAFSSRARQALVLELTAHAPGEPCATAWPDNQTYSFWRRRIAHETAVHRVDVQAALGLPVDPVAVDFAADGVDEVLQFWFGHRLRQIGMTATIQGAVGIQVSDLSWLAILGRVRSTARRVPASDARSADAVVTGDPMSVYLWLWGRVPDQSVTITGDIDATAQLWALLRTATQ